MTETAFTKITGVTTYACEGCARNEFTAAVDLDKYAGLFPQYLYSLPPNERGLDCNFYKGRLFKISLPAEIKQIDEAKRKYAAQYGHPTKVENWDNGLSQVTWENKSTLLALSYVRVQGDAYPLTLPVGTIVTVEYIDRSLWQALEKQSSEEK